MQKDDVVRFEEYRRFHDAWAFVLYVIAFLGINIILLLNRKSVNYAIGSMDYGEIAWIVGINFLFVVSSVIICYLMMIYMPRLTIYASIFIHTTIMILNAFLTPGGPDAFGIILVVAALILFTVYFLSIHRHMDFIVKMVSSSTSILIGNFGIMLSAMLFLGLFSFVQFAIVVLADHKNSLVHALTYAILLVLFWTLFNSQYVVQVFVSSLVVAETTRNNEERGKLNLAFRNTFAALGSICLGGLLLALITVVRIFLSDLRDRNSRRSDGGSMLYIIVFNIAHVLECCISCANRMTFPYLALHGTCYKDSVIESSSLIIGSDAKNLAAFIGVDLAIGLLSLILTSLLFFINLKFFENITFDFSSGMIIIFALFLVFYFLHGMLSMISAGCLALIYVNISAPDSLINYDQELSDIITQKRIEMG